MPSLKHSIFPILGALFAASSGGQSASPAQAVDAPGDLAVLVPEGDLVYVQLESLERLDELSAMLSEQTGSPVELSEDLRGMMGAQLGGDQVDATRPIGIAADPTRMMSGGSPVSAVLLPAKDPSALAGSLQTRDGLPQAEIEGSYVAVPQGQSFTRGTGPSPLTQKLLPGTVSARVKLGTLLETLRPLIDAALDQAMAMLGSVEVELDTGELDIEGLMQLYREGFEVAMDSADVLDLAFDAEGTELDFAFEFLAAEGSQLATFAKDSKGGTTKLAGFLESESDFLMFANGDMKTMFDEFLPVLDDLVAFYPENIQAILDAYLPLYIETAELLGGEIVTNLNWEPDGFSAEYFLAADDTDKLVASFQKMLRLEYGTELGVTVGPFETTSVGELEVTRSTIQIDYEKMLMLYGEGFGVDGEQVAEMVENLYGGNELEIAFATSGGVLAVYAGAIGSGAEETMKRFQAGPGKVSEELEADLAELEQGRLGGVMRMDMGSYLNLAMQSAEQLLEDSERVELPDLTGTKAVIAMDFRLVGRAWRGGMNMDMAAMSELMTSMGK